MGYFIVAVFALMFFYFISNTIIKTSIINHKRDLRLLKVQIKTRIKCIKIIGPLTEEEKIQYKDTIHTTIMRALKKQTFISLFRKYIGIPGAMFALVSAFITFFYFHINTKFNPLLDLISLLNQSDIQIDRVSLSKLENNIKEVSRLSDGSLAISSLSQLLLTILVIVEYFTNETQALNEELEVLEEELQELIADS